jgi:hypothetical protein
MCILATNHLLNNHKTMENEEVLTPEVEETLTETTPEEVVAESGDLAEEVAE